MGCVSSTLLTHTHDDDHFTRIGASSTAFAHHFVSLTSSTYGLLDPPLSHDPPSPTTTTTTTTTIPPTPPPRFTLGSLPLSSDLRPLKPDHIINSWELMAGLDSTCTSTSTPTTAFLPFSPLGLPSYSKSPAIATTKENSNPNLPKTSSNEPLTVIPKISKHYPLGLDGFEYLCPPSGENKVVIYTTTLRGIRSTFEACNAVRSAIEGLGVLICERDISMDRGFRDELRQLMQGKDNSHLTPPRVFVKGRYIGGAEEVTRIAEDGVLGNLLSELPKFRAGHVCEGCGGLRFLPCFQCNGSRKMVTLVEQEMMDQTPETVVVRCSDCNENGLVLCPICS